MDRDWLALQLASGRSIESIARDVGLDSSTVGYWLKKHGLTSTHAPRHAARGALPRARLDALVARDFTVREIADEVDRSIGTVRHWLRRYGLETTREARRRKTRGRPLGRTEGECHRHGRTAFVVREGGSASCLRCRSERVVARRRRLKEILVADAGGRCLVCGYDRCIGALEFHHLDPEQKRFGLGMRGLTRSLNVLRQEAQKCVLLCSNCHVEVEAGVSNLPSQLPVSLVAAIRGSSIGGAAPC